MALSWVEANIARTTEDGLSAADIDEVANHTDATQEDLFGPLSVVCPWVGNPERQADADAYRAAGAAAMRLGDADSTGHVLSAVTEIMSKIRDLMDDMLADLAELGASGGLSAAQVADAHEGVESATESIEAALMALDPSRTSVQIRQTADPDERIAMASDQERIELHREQTQRTIAYFDALSRASDKLIAFHTGRRQRYAELRPKLEAAQPANAPRLIADLRTLGLQQDEAEALVSMFRFGARMRARSN